MPLVGLNRSTGRSRSESLRSRIMPLILHRFRQFSTWTPHTYAVVVTQALHPPTMSGDPLVLPSHLADATGSDSALRRFLHGLPGVDQGGAEARAAALATRSIKTTSKAWALDACVRMVDLTTLEGADTPGKVRSLCAKAVRPDPTDGSTPPVAAVCVYPDLVEVALEAVRGSTVKVASVATAFPSGRSSLAVKLADVRAA